ncbi:SulP family inorganic anion transporter [Neptunomonas qingdaonensis]|uniref:Sulfate permease, SulP family n=1 Tax=Neptunomonas qingdaonensis TaxID=1045558 RepID=A0A1I2M8R9_9GAMM|nr:sulfate permease [Neptunomonas qingdaonensis]SFF87895.1 sulfate permease, SulP family [Neptunomonas qingdaonensis]
MNIKRFFPILEWLPSYCLTTFNQDLLAAVIVTVMLIPQSLAYAMLAGLPPEVGLYASIAPLILYAVFGTSRTLSVGPVAVIALMTGATAGAIALPGSSEYITSVLLLTFLSGAMLTLMGLLRLGFLANFLSHPVISGFITASAVIIAFSQLKHLLGVSASGHNVLSLFSDLVQQIPNVHLITLAMGTGTLIFLYAARWWLKPMLSGLGIPAGLASGLGRLAPIIAVIVTTWICGHFALADAGLAVVGQIPAGMPPLTLPGFDTALWSQLAVGALLISIVGFVESVSVGQTLAAKRRQRIDPNQELIGLGSANLGAAFSAGMPVTGGFSRSVVNFDAGAQTPAAGAMTALGIMAVILWFTPLLSNLPIATLAATIIVAVLSLIDLHAITHTWRYSRTDFSAILVTILITLLQGVEAGIMAGVGLSLALHLYRTSLPHSAVIGRIAGTEHFRNVERHQVETDPRILILRIDESLYFPNSRYLEDRISELTALHPQMQHLILSCQAVNHIDTSALDSLEVISQRLRDAGIALHLAEVKGPVMDRLKAVDFPQQLNGRVFMSTYDACKTLKKDSYLTAAESVENP